MKKISPIFILTICLSTISAFSQSGSDPVVLTVGDSKVTRSEFETVYRKNNKETSGDLQKALEEYMELYINFRMKVKEAEEAKLDTGKAFKDELAGYRKQLSQPYLVDKEVSDKLLKEAYDRQKTDVKASHILIKCEQNALPKDTLAAFNKALEIRKKVLAGEKFEDLAKKYSEDPSAKDNGGDLGYFTSMQMVYPFENAAYNTPVGQVSQPVRTKYGYHILKIFDKRDAQGQVLAAHIMVKVAKDAKPEDTAAFRTKINEIYQKLVAGGDFKDLAKQFSDDKQSATKGGELPWFGTGRMVPEFEKAAFALKNNGDYSTPFKTSYGWHIVKRLDRKGIPSFEEQKNDLKQKVSKDSRSQLSKESIIARVKKEYGFSEDLKKRDEFVSVVDTNVFKGLWKIESAKNLKSFLFKIGDKQYTQTDFATFISKHQAKRSAIDMGVYIGSLYKQFVDESCIAFEDTKLEGKYADFRNLMKEYRDGILLFDLTDKKVWSKAVKDSIGLKAYYENNKSNYMWEERLDATIYTCKDAEVAKKVREQLMKQNKSGKPSDEEIKAELNKDSQLNLKVETGKFIKGEMDVLESVKWEPGISPDIAFNGQIVVVNVKGKVAPTPKTLNEAKGLVTADYQVYLEKEWIDSLRKKYPFQVNKDVLFSIK
ncbi:MAG: peptidylprolyl isomerase [Bacteroidia bacterium]|nr:peptidylprolyl isomerase [Bacteroidia bacterium]